MQEHIPKQGKSEESHAIESYETQTRNIIEYVREHLIAHEPDTQQMPQATKDKIALKRYERDNKLNRLEMPLRVFCERVGIITDSLEDSAHERERVAVALTLMMRLHIDQSDRADGTGPYITHLLEVATGILDSYTEADVIDVCIAALLHDVVEDQSSLLALAQEQLEEMHQKDAHEIAQLDEKDALTSIGQLFDDTVEDLVRRVSVPVGIYKDAKNKKEKRRLYQDFVQSIVDDTDHPAAFAIKWQDARANMLTIQRIWDMAEMFEEHAARIEASHEGVVQEDSELRSAAEKRRNIYKKLRNKYKPVLRDVFLPAFKQIPKEHLLASQAEQAIRDIENALETQFNVDRAS